MEPTHRQQVLQYLSAAGLAPTPQNMQRVQQLMNAGGGGDAGDASGNSSRALNRISGTTTSPAPIARPRAKQGNQAGPNSSGPAAQPINSESQTSLTAPYSFSQGGDNGDAGGEQTTASEGAPSTAPVAAVDTPPAAGLTSNITMQDIATALGLTAGAGVAGLGARAIIGKRPARIGEAGDIGVDPMQGGEMDPRLLNAPESAAMAPGDVGTGETAGGEMDPNIKPNVPAEMQPGDLAEQTLQRIMGGGDVGVNGPRTTPNLSLEDMLKGTNRQINEGMTVVPRGQRPVEPDPPSEGNIMPDGALDPTSIPGEHIPEASMGTDLNAADQGSVAARARSENDAKVRASVDLEKDFDKSGLLDGLMNTNGDLAKLKALERQWSTRDFETASKILAKRGIAPAGSIKNSADLVKALTRVLKVIR